MHRDTRELCYCVVCILLKHIYGEPITIYKRRWSRCPGKEAFLPSGYVNDIQSSRSESQVLILLKNQTGIVNRYVHPVYVIDMASLYIYYRDTQGAS